MSQVSKPAPVSGIQAASQRPNAHRIITAQRPEQHHSPVTQRLLPARRAAASHDPASGYPGPSGVPVG
jgi:hypothetical protein